MSEEPIYRIIRGSIRKPRTKGGPILAGRKGLIMQGELLPRGVFTKADIRSWLNGGRIELANVSIEQAEEVAAVRAANPFRADPVTLVGATKEDLIIMVLEIDPEYDVDTLVNDEDAVRLLTSGWVPSMRQTIAPVNDRSRPKALALHNLEQVDGVPATSSSAIEMSAEASANLESARAKAQAPADTEE